MVMGLSFSDRRHPAGPGGRGRRWGTFAIVPALVFLFAFAATQTAPAAPAAPAQAPAAEPLKEPTLSLFKAVELNDMAGVQASLEAGADLEAENSEGMTAADLAVDKGHFIIAHYLLSRRILGQAPPVALVPGKAKEAVTAAAKAKPKRKFASPPAKPAPPASAEAMPAEPARPPPRPPAAPVSPVPGEAPEMAARPEAPESGAPAEVTEAPEPGAPAEVTEAPEPGAPAEVTEAPPAPEPDAEPAVEKRPAGEPLAETGVSQFFKSLVELITPGGEAPPKPAEWRAVAGAAVGASKPEADFQADESIVESVIEETDQTVVEAPEETVFETVEAAPESEEVIQEVAEKPSKPLEDTDLEALPEEPGLDKAAGDGKPAEAKPDKETEGFLQRMASLFKSDKKAGPGPDTARLPGTDEVKAYELPLPGPQAGAPTRFSPRFLDRLADFLETGDEKEFRAWLPEMQIMGPGIGTLGAPPAPAAEAGAEPAPETPPLVEAGPAPPPEAVKTAPVETAELVPAKPAEEAPAKPPETQEPWATTMEKPGGPPGGVPPTTKTGAPREPGAPGDAAAAEGEETVAPETTAPPPEADAAAEGKAEQAAEGAAPAETVAEVPPAPEKPGVMQKVFEKLTGALTPDFGDRERPERLVLEPEEKLAAADVEEGEEGEVAEAAEKEAADKEAPPRYWPVTDVETAEAPPLAARPRPGPGRVLLRTSLTGVTLSLGQSVTLENTFPPIGEGIDPFNKCVKKNRGTTLFCLEAVDWPDAMQADFLVPTILYTGYKAIARYDQGIASRFHALFPSEAFERVAAYFHKRFGDPTDAWNRSIAPFAQPRQDNPTLAWRSLDPKSGAVTVLEIRKYDDTRGGFPDTSRGAVMLYLANSPPIFPQVSSHELMRLSRARMGAPGQPPPAAEGGPAAEGAPAAEPAQMTAEEMQAERRKRKAAEAAAKADEEQKAKSGAAPGAEAPGTPGAESFDLPPDPLGR